MTDITSSRPMVEYALAYAGRGWRVFPLHSVHSGDCSCGRDTCSSVGKHPRTKNGVKDATTDFEQITRWWTTWPQANIGIATGIDPASGQGLYVIDIDTAKGADPSDFADLMARTLTVRTGSGGFHLYLQCEEPLPNTAGKLGPFIDTRGEGGYVVAPPSHNRAGKYGWQPGSREVLEVSQDLLTLLKHLHDLPFGVQHVSLHQKKEETQHEISSHPQAAETHHPALAANQASAAPSAAPAQEDVSQEERNNFLIILAGKLRALGFDVQEIRVLLHQANQLRYGNGKHPKGPLTFDEVEATVLKSVKKWEEAGGVVQIAVPVMKPLSGLMRADQPELVWVVPGLLCEGLILLAGKPKIGKSLLVLNLALTCALGTANGGGLALEQYAVEPVGVFYLSLEDGPRRFQKRVDMLLNGRPVPENFGYALTWKPFHAGGLDDLETCLLAAPDTRLVVVDTLNNVRPPVRGNGMNPVEEGQFMTSLQRLALRHHIALVVIHHLRKGESEDEFDNISGTTGMQSANDTMLTLSGIRGKSEARLKLTGRDINTFTLGLVRDEQTGLWRCTGEVADDDDQPPRRASQPSASRQDILALLAEKGGMTPAEIAKELGKQRNNVQVLLHKMLKDGSTIVRDAQGRYSRREASEREENV